MVEVLEICFNLGNQLLISGQPIDLGYVIVRHMLSTPAVNYRLLPYGSIITKILQCFEVPLLDAGSTKTRWIGPEAMTSIGFSRKNGQWIKTKNSKNWDTLIALEDDRILNDVYSLDQLQDFRLGAHPPPLRRRSVPQPSADSDIEERTMDTDQPSTSGPPLLLCSLPLLSHLQLPSSLLLQSNHQFWTLCCR